MFRDNEDFEYYLSKLKQFKKKYKVAILGYCLISNHYHLFLKQLSDISINKFLLAVNTSYGNYFNKKYGRVGYLTQDRYKQSIIKSDEQFDWIAVYVNCNYELHGLGSAKDYEWSSYRDYLGLRQGAICDITEVSGRFENIEEFEKFCDETVKEIKEKKMWEKMDDDL